MVRRGEARCGAAVRGQARFGMVRHGETGALAPVLGNVTQSLADELAFTVGFGAVRYDAVRLGLAR